MSSSQTGEPRPHSSRVIKSGTDVAERFAFPALKQGVLRELSPLLPEAGRPQPALARESVPVAVRPEAAAEAEARARALERRAAHVLQEAQEAAANRVAEAEARACEVLDDAAAEAGQIRAGARNAGYDEGFAAGRQEGLDAGRAEADVLMEAARQEADALLAEAQAVAVSIREGALEERNRLLDASQQQMLDLAFALARQILRVELALNPDSVLPMVEAAVAKLKGEEEPHIRVNPAVKQLLDDYRGRLLAALPGARRMLIEADPALEQGDFQVSGAQGYIDGRLDSQIGLLQAELKAEER
ncbi:MAG TPA: FliH/SctL family protein [Symbiobacteriaceae bacterium]|nr:FliH/SctL family protein [Symbiobacteriaceae bacterium]